MKRILALGLVLILGACAGAPPDPAPAPVVATLPATHQPCTELWDWPKQEQADLGNALLPVYGNADVQRLLKDWQRMRDEAVACKKSQPAAAAK